MIRTMLAGVIVVATLASTACARITMIIPDLVDDDSLVEAVSGQEPVKKFRQQIDAFVAALCRCNEKEIERVLGKPIVQQRASPSEQKEFEKDFEEMLRGKLRRPPRLGTYAMPVAQPRRFTMSGLRPAHPRRTIWSPIEPRTWRKLKSGMDPTGKRR